MIKVDKKSSYISIVWFLKSIKMNLRFIFYFNPCFSCCEVVMPSNILKIIVESDE